VPAEKICPGIRHAVEPFVDAVGLGWCFVEPRCGRRAAAAGLKTRPTRETARDTIAWWKTLPAERTASLRAGLSPEREAGLLATWNKRGA